MVFESTKPDGIDGRLDLWLYHPHCLLGVVSRHYSWPLSQTRNYSKLSQKAKKTLLQTTNQMPFPLLHKAQTVPSKHFPQMLRNCLIFISADSKVSNAKCNSAWQCIPPEEEGTSLPQDLISLQHTQDYSVSSVTRDLTVIRLTQVPIRQKSNIISSQYKEIAIPHSQEVQFQTLLTHLNKLCHN